MGGGNKTDRPRQPPSPADPRHTAYRGRITGKGDAVPVPTSTPAGSSRLPGLHEALEELAILGALSMHRSRVRIPYASPHWVQSVVAWHTCLASRRTGLKSRWIHQSAGSPHRAGKGAHPEGRAPAGPGFTKVRVPWANRPSRHPLKVEIPGSNPGGTASQQGGVG